MWTREKAISWINEHQYIATDGDFEHIVMDGEGQDLYAAISELNKDFSPEELGKLLVFVFNDYVKVVNKLLDK
jgi:cobalamin biosynthesis Co2+ chelatase CbiK